MQRTKLTNTSHISSVQPLLLNFTLVAVKFDKTVTNAISGANESGFTSGLPIDLKAGSHSLSHIFQYLIPSFTSYSRENFIKEFQKTIACRNLHIARNFSAYKQSSSGYTNLGSHVESRPILGVDNSAPKADSTARDAATIQNVLKVCGNQAEIELALDNCGLSVTEDLVLQVLQRHRSNWKPAFLFFTWSSRQHGYSHGSRAYNEMLDILGRMKCFELMWKLIDEILQEKVISLITERTFAILLNRHAAAHKVEAAIEIFCKRREFSLECNGFAFHTLLMSLCRYKHVEAAEHLFYLKADEFPPDIKSRNIILNGWCVLGNLHEAKRFWKDIISSGCKPDLFTYGIFINCLTKKGKLSKARELFEAMWKKGCPPDVTICNCIIDALCFKKKIPDALIVFSKMSEQGCLPNTATYNSLIKHLCKIRRMEKAYELLDEMGQKGCPPNAITYHYFLRSAKTVEELLELSQRLARTGYVIMGDTYNLILKMHVRLNNVEEIQSVWAEMEKNGMGPDRRSYTIMIHGLYNKGEIDRARCFFNEMTEKGIMPEPKTVSLIEAMNIKRGESQSMN